MLGLPKATEVQKQLPKKAIYAKFQLDTQAKEKLDADIARMTIVHEMNPTNTMFQVGNKVQSFFVLYLHMKRKVFDEKNIAMLSKLIPQNILFVLGYEGEEKLAIYHTKLMQTPWQVQGTLAVTLDGQSLDDVWDSVVAQVGGVVVEQGRTLDEQLSVDEKRQRLEREIARLDKLARKEKQPKKKFALVQEVNGLKRELEGI